MWVSGAGSRVRYLQETGLMEEILLENMHRNPDRNFSVWDSVLYEIVKKEANIDLLLNCACCDAVCENGAVKSVTGFQLTTYTWFTVEATLFADCSGDSILAELTGAEYMVGTEGKAEYGESLAPEKGNRMTMGMSLMIQAHETDHPCSFTPPEWAYTYPTDESMNNKPHECLTKVNTNFYWIELGGEGDSIRDTEETRDELLKIAFGVWDHIKNQGDHGAENWELDWIGFLPGKRESRRYKGDYVMTQDDVIGARRFPDTVAYGGWQIDNHLPGGFRLPGGAQEGHLQKVRLREPYGIPLRSLYSVNISNLMFAGRNISATHLAFASARVMGTCAVMGQAVGTAAALMTAAGLPPREYCAQRIGELQAALMEDDCFLPGFVRAVPALMQKATLSAEYGDPSPLQNGTDRRIWGKDNGYWGLCNCAVTYTFAEKTHVDSFRLVADSDLDREYVEGNPDAVHISCTLFRRRDYNYTTFGFPKCLLKSFCVQVKEEDGAWRTVYDVTDNHQRLIRAKIDADTVAVRLVPRTTWFSETLWNTYGSAEAHLFSFDLQ